MGFVQTRFLGASITSLDASVGWNEQASSVTVSLVEDRSAGDRFAPPAVGTPAAVTLGGFHFEGLVQHQRRLGSFEGEPTYQVILTDPRPLLENVQVILSCFTGAAPVPNLINAYGYWEAELGFGGSMVNESGMVWSAPANLFSLVSDGGGVQLKPASTEVGIRAAVSHLTRNPGPYGGPIRFRGRSYAVDLSGLPPAPAFYRIGGVSRPLLEIISELCQDAGCDYQVRLAGDVIGFKTVSRTRQPAPGAIARFVMSSELASSRSYGVELRNDFTNAVLLGGDVHDLVPVVGGGDTIVPFWGFDVDGRVILGQGDPTADGYTVDLNAESVADIVGGTSYTVDLPELRCAMDSYESWAFYVTRQKPAVALVLGIANTVDAQSDLAELFPEVLLRRDLVAIGADDASHLGAMNASDFWTARCQRIYDFVRQHATEYFGAKFLVKVPFFLYWKAVPETTEVVATREISTEGGYVAEGSDPLALPYFDLDKFATQDGRVECFVTIPVDPAMDLAAISPDVASIADGKLYLRASVDSRIVYPPGSIYPYGIVSLAQPVYQAPPDPLGGVAAIAAILGVDVAALNYAVGVRHGSFPIRIGPNPYLPDAAAIPMKDNRQSYGPWGTFGRWGASGPEGKVYFERDEGLVPWAYGDYDTLNQAAAAKVAGLATAQLEADSGDVEEADVPRVSIGDALVAGGPEVTSISVRYGVGGVGTSYTMQSFTPQFGAFQRQNADRLRRLGLAAQQIRRSVRGLFLRRQAAQNLQATAAIGAAANYAHAVAQRTPHDVVLATMSKSASLGYRTQASSMTVDELLANMRADDAPTYALTGGMGLEGLYRPFSTGHAPGSGDPDADLPHFEASPDQVRLTAKAPCTQTLDPIRYSDIDVLVNGTDYAPRDASGDPDLSGQPAEPTNTFGGGLGGPLARPGIDPAIFRDDDGLDLPTIHRLKGLPDYDHARGVGLRSPAVLVGYGVEYTGKPFPNANDETQPVHTWSDQYADHPRLHPEKWRAGILAVHWDDWRKCYTVPTILRGTLDAPLTDDTGVNGVLMTITVNGSPLTRTVAGSPLPDKVKVYNDLGGGTIAANTKVVVVYYPLANRWFINGGVACS